MNFGKLTAAVLACVVWTAAVPARVNAEESDFDRFCEEEFTRRMESDYMTMHYTLKDYRAFGVTKPELTIGDASCNLM